MANRDLTAAAAVARRIISQTKACLGLTLAAVYRVDDESGSLVTVATSADFERQGGHVLLRETGIVNVALEDGRIVTTPNVLMDSRLRLSDATRASIERVGPRAALVVPLTIHERTIGAVAAGAIEGRVFTEAEMALAQALTDKVAMALENVRLAEESAARQRRLTTMIEVARKLSSQLDLSSVLNTVAEAAVRVFEAEVGFRLLEGEDLVLRGATPGARQFMRRERLKLGESISGRVAATGEPIVTLDAGADPRAIPDHRAGRPRALMCVPIRGGSRVIGTLNIYGEHGRRFDDDALTLALSLAAQAGVALENARLYEEASHRRREAETLARVGASLTERLDVPAVAQHVVEGVHALLDTWTATLRLLEPDGSLRAIAFGGARREHRTGDVLPAGIGLSAIVIATGEPASTPDAITDPRITLPDELRETLDRSGQTSMIAVPLRVKDQVIGVLNAGDVAGRVFTDPEIAILQTFADQAAIALENARLFTEGERRRVEAEVFADVTRSITATLDLDTILQRVVEAARALSHADTARIGLCELPDDALVFRYSTGTRADYSGLRVRRGQGITGAVLASGQPVRTREYLADARIVKVRPELVEEEGTIGELAVPITVEERVGGVVTVTRRSAQPFADRDERVLQRLADHAAIAIRNGRLFAAERQARDAAEASERAWRQSESQYRQLVEGSIQGLYVHSAFVIRMANAALARLYGFSNTDDLIGMEVWSLIAPRERRRLEGYAAARLRGDAAPADYECQGVRKDGSAIWVENRVSLTTWEGAPAYLVTVVDISERKQAEEALRRSEEQLRQSQKMEAVGQLAGGIAHDFNNLLTVIMARNEMVTYELSTDDPRRRHLALVQQTADRASALVRQLLAFSRRQRLDLVILDLNVVVSDMMKLLLSLTGATIHLTFTPEAELGRVRADRSQLEQVLLNLVVNARDAMPEGGHLSIDTASVAVDDAVVACHPGLSPGAYIVLSVRDTGSGMTPEVQARVFEPFFTTKEPGKGTGLGLSTIYGIVKQSEGDVVIDSAPGQGATFRIYLPRADGRDEPDAPVVAETRGGTETILLVDDDSDVRLVAQEILASAGYTVLEARHPGEALLIGERHTGPLDVLLTDVVMPEMNGRELADRLRILRPGLRVLFMSGHADTSIHPRAGTSADVMFLAKPFTPSLLGRTVRQLLA